MLEIRGMRGLRYNAEKVGGLGQVVTPPYDVISPEERAALAETSPYNMVHLLLPTGKNGGSPYEDAAERLRSWQDEGVLFQDDAESLYLVEQSFNAPDGRPYVRRGFFAATRIPEDDEDVVLGHERTFDKPVEDRLALTEATQANLGAVFVLYSDVEGVLHRLFQEAENRAPEGEARTIDGVVQRVWRVPYTEDVGAFFRDKRLYIADGHHRFLTAKMYRDRMRAAGHAPGPHPWEYVMMAFVAFEDPGLNVYPTHRVVPPLDNFDPAAFLRDLAEWFEVTPIPEGIAERVAADSGSCTFGLVLRGHGTYLLQLRDIDRTALLGDDHGPAWRDLDVAVLHRGIFERILGLPAGHRYTYEKEAANAIEAIERGIGSMAFLMRAPSAAQVRACAEAAERMPQKATYFFPKIASGLVMHKIG